MILAVLIGYWLGQISLLASQSGVMPGKASQHACQAQWTIRANKHKLVVAWIEIHREDLLADWELAVHGKKPFPIKGLDQ